MEVTNTQEMNTIVPYVIEQTSSGERSYDIYSRLLKDRIIMLTSQFNGHLASSIVSQLMFLENEDNTQPIRLYINSPGGSVNDGLAIYSVMNFIKSPVHTYVLGMAASMGSFIANAGEAGHRYVLSESRTMVHRVSAGYSGARGTMYNLDLELQDTIRSHEETVKLNKRLTDLYVKHNSKGKTVEDFTEIMRFDTYLSSEEAVEIGVADHILTKAE